MQQMLVKLVKKIIFFPFSGVSKQREKYGKGSNVSRANTEHKINNKKKMKVAINHASFH